MAAISQLNAYPKRQRAHQKGQPNKNCPGWRHLQLLLGETLKPIPRTQLCGIESAVRHDVVTKLRAGSSMRGLPEKPRRHLRFARNEDVAVRRSMEGPREHVPVQPIVSRRCNVFADVDPGGTRWHLLPKPRASARYDQPLRARVNVRHLSANLTLGL